MDYLDCYTAVAVQPEPIVVLKRKQIEQNLNRALEILESSVYSTPNAKAPLAHCSGPGSGPTSRSWA